ncbi:hypothetical protein ES707_18610 [subsurface metagenome]
MGIVSYLPTSFTRFGLIGFTIGFVSPLSVAVITFGTVPVALPKTAAPLATLIIFPYGSQRAGLVSSESQNIIVPVLLPVSLPQAFIQVSYAFIASSETIYPIVPCSCDALERASKKAISCGSRSLSARTSASAMASRQGKKTYFSASSKTGAIAVKASSAAFIWGIARISNLSCHEASLNLSMNSCKCSGRSRIRSITSSRPVHRPEIALIALAGKPSRKSTRLVFGVSPKNAAMSSSEKPIP